MNFHHKIKTVLLATIVILIAGCSLEPPTAPSDPGSDSGSSNLIVETRPNLVVTRFSLTGVDSVAQGADLSGQLFCHIQNSEAPVNSLFIVGFYLSEDPVLTPDNHILLGVQDVYPKLDVDAEKRVIAIELNPIPRDWPKGTAYIKAVIDDGKVIEESNELDNSASLEVTVIGNKAFLVKDLDGNMIRYTTGSERSLD